ncbi:MAG: PilC/PilY family type IV pilus protein [Cellvibrio sp.]|uniref:pilus assembly protein n=1 Tax=Cellvibrio sp. TaxID=1965322 RepID=UPI0031A87A8A
MMMLKKFVATIDFIVRCFPVRKVSAGVSAFFFSLVIVHAANAAPAQYPLFLSNPVVPIMMLNMSKDHQLYFKVYDDYSDLDGDKIPDITYKNSYEYYGYFDSKKCYTYSTTNNRFVPSRKVNGSNYCNYGGTTTEWSGNFLNWASMTRMDSIRKILYGGLRSTDTSGLTVLERAFLPHDAHSFAKYYNGTDLSSLTPFNDAAAVPRGLTGTEATGITICNTSPAGGKAVSQLADAAPLLRVAKGNYTFWASNERWQCRWNSEISAANGNTFAATGNYAYGNTPINGNKIGTGSASGEFSARVEVCVKDLEEANCYTYPNGNKKPQGLLQEYGEVRGGASVSKINFGLLTGSYSKNKSGGVLRKTIGNMSGEINSTTDGTFTGAAGVIKTLNLLRIYGYRYDDGTYFNTTASDNCSWALNSFSNGSCSNWGNPQAEIYLESLRYLAGKSANPSFNTDDSSRIAGLTTATWSAPVTTANACAPLNVLQFNASTTSYDGDELSTVTDIMSSGSLNDWTNLIADPKREALSGSYFMGKNASAANGLCTAKTLGLLSDVRGTCPDAPRLEGSYHLAGLAYYARTNDFISGVSGVQTVRTYGVALAPALPKVEIPVPGSTSGKKVTILPACRELSVGTSPNNGACAIVDFKILSQSSTSTTNSGKLYVNWEDSEQGGDYDQDLWGVIDYSVTATKVTIGTKVIISSVGSNKIGFGYVISGTKSDGPHFHSGINGYSEYECSNCQVSNAMSYRPWDIGESSDKSLESPLFYAAKWGGFSDELVKTVVGVDTYTDAKRTTFYPRDDVLAAVKASDASDTYFFATDPRKLEASLGSAFDSIAASIGSSSAVATNSTRLSEGSYVFQAQFNSEGWSGTLNAFEFAKDGTLPVIPTFSTSNASSMPRTGVGRNVYTFNGTDRVNFAWGNLTTAQKLALRLGSETTDVNAQKRADWLVGNATNENKSTGLRERGAGDKRVILGDIVNSSPAYVGAWDFRYHRLPVGGSSYRDYVETKKTKMPRIFVGANDGMVHAFQAPTKDISGGNVFKELYAYVPNIAFSKLANLTKPDYGSASNPHQFIVDGPITVGDAYIGGSWRTIVVGTMGAGGRGIYALDVTDASGPPKVLWELSEADYPALGYVVGKPLIVPMTNNRWAVVLGNGSESGAFSSLLVIDIEAPRNTSYSKVLSTGVGVGLSAPELLPNGVGQVEVAYAGDLSGNLWRFKLSDKDSPTDASKWKKEYLLFKAVDKDGKAQPIQAAPTLGLNPKMNNKIMVYFGAGKYFDVGDNATPTSPQYSFYAIADTGSEITRSNLFAKTLSTTYAGVASTRKVVQDAASPVQSPDWTVHKGWRLDFADTAGERITTKAILLQDRLFFPTLIPSGVACEYGGKSWLMEVCAVGTACRSGGRTTTNLLNDYLVLGDIGLGKLPEKSGSDSSTSGAASSGSSSSEDNGCTNASTGEAAIIGSGTDATLMNIKTTYSKCGEGRQSWRQLQ